MCVSSAAKTLYVRTRLSAHTHTRRSYLVFCVVVDDFYSSFFCAPLSLNIYVVHVDRLTLRLLLLLLPISLFRPSFVCRSRKEEKGRERHIQWFVIPFIWLFVLLINNTFPNGSISIESIVVVRRLFVHSPTRRRRYTLHFTQCHAKQQNRRRWWCRWRLNTYVITSTRRPQFRFIEYSITKYRFFSDFLFRTFSILLDGEHRHVAVYYYYWSRSRNSFSRFFSILHPPVLKPTSVAGVSFRSQNSQNEIFLAIDAHTIRPRT